MKYNPYASEGNKPKIYSNKDCTLSNPPLELDKNSLEQYKMKAGFPKNFMGCIEPSRLPEYLQDKDGR